MSNRTAEEAKAYRLEHRDQFREYQRKWKEKNIHRIKDIQESWKANNPERFREIKRNWNARNKDRQAPKIWARNQVNNAINDGRLLRSTKCSSCSREGRMDAHHEDYSKPFEIVWLCRKCHYDLHKSRGERP